MEIYTPIEQAGQIIRQRWQDQKLRKAVEEKLQGDIPEILKDGPSGMIWRQICTADGEFKRFLNLCEKAKLKPIGLEYIRDKFYAGNFTKYNLAKLIFIDKKSEKIIDFKNAEQKRMRDLQTLWGENLVDFHHFLLSEAFPEVKNRTIDLSDWVVRNGKIPQRYYFNIFSFAVCYGVYFEDFYYLKSEEEFVNKVILPAFNEVEKYFGVKPVVVRIAKEGEQQKDPYWYAYSQEIKEIMENHKKEFKKPNLFLNLWKSILQLNKPAK